MVIEMISLIKLIQLSHFNPCEPGLLAICSKDAFPAQYHEGQFRAGQSMYLHKSLTVLWTNGWFYSKSMY